MPSKKTHLFPPRYAGSAACLLAVLSAYGCGGGKTLPDGYAPAFGKVTLDGAPVKDAEVIFVTEKGESYGRTNAEGAYTMERSRTQEGAGMGKALVKISTRAVWDDMSEEGLEYDDEVGGAVRKETIPDHYKDGIEIEVTADGAPYDFLLTSTPPTS